MTRSLCLVVLILAFSASASAQLPQPAGTGAPSTDAVPDASTAIRIAEAVWLPIYGDRIYEKRPFVATLRGEVWLVSGTLPKDALGGVPQVRIAKRDGRVLEVGHGQ